jgi:hypothetical protein
LSDGQRLIAVVKPACVSTRVLVAPGVVESGVWRREWIISSFHPNSLWISRLVIVAIRRDQDYLPCNIPFFLNMSIWGRGADPDVVTTTIRVSMATPAGGERIDQYTWRSRSGAGPGMILGYQPRTPASQI